MNATSSGPLLQLLSNGLQLWIRSQCDDVGELKLTLQGSALQLLRGKLDGVSLTARKVSFQKLPLLRAELKTGALRAHINPSHPGQPIQLSHPFNIDGEVVLSGTDLNRAFASDRWRWLGDLLSEQLMGRVDVCSKGTCFQFSTQEWEFLKTHFAGRQGHTVQLASQKLQGRTLQGQLQLTYVIALAADPKL